ncbi:hypothetical protein KBC31_02760 [Candidatus Saccharibacteria bacterium]|jgi:2-phosphoglycerate kinase|nr:hypothetical protein [Candidatus Saccharibacteria bacterium]
MIYLIGGPPKCGKTTLAKKLSLNSKIPWVSADTIQNVIKPYVDGSDFNSIFPVSSANFSSNDEKYNLLSTDEIIKSYRAQAKSMFAAIEAFVLSEITEGNDYIVEGYHLEPQYIDTLTQSHPGKVKGIVLAKFNESAFIDSITKSTTENDWILSKTTDENTYIKIAKMVSVYSHIYEVESKRYGIKLMRMDNDFEKSLHEAVGRLADLQE